jgi:hypothetical protein
VTSVVLWIINHLQGGFHSISFPSEWGGLHYTPYTGQDVQRPFARLPKITPQNSFNPAEEIAETLAQQCCEAPNETASSQPFSPQPRKLPEFDRKSSSTN